MNFRTIVLVVIVAAIAALAALNWPALATPTLISLGITSIQAPLGVIMLALTILLGVFFIAYVLSLQGSVLLETRRHAKEMAAQRELADKAEASRFTELRAFLEGQHRNGHDALIARIDTLESRLAARAQESDNTTAAYVGQLEDQLRQRGAGTPAVPAYADPTLRADPELRI
ncbi:LapA family protein [Paracidovorax wautersii]|uniref:LapA family protein n=1 Tax=Paracidovorax wautersii TaxID=1177982 RepID=UPI0031D7B94E